MLNSFGDYFEDVAFTGYAARCQAVEDIINTVVNSVDDDYDCISLNADIDLSEDECDYIQREVRRRLGVK